MSIKKYRQLSLKWKLTLAMILVATVVSLLEITLYLVHDQETFFHSKRIKLHIISEIVAANAVSALKFADRKDALEIMSSLSFERNLRFAQLFDEKGGLLAEYIKDGEKLPVAVKLPERREERRDDDSYYLSTPIMFDNKYIGMLYLVSDLSDLQERRNMSLIQGLVVGALFLLVSVSMALWLQGIFTRPIRGLLRVIRNIATKKDYSLRARESSADEFGDLVKGFNQMISEVEQRDARLANQMLLLEKTNRELDQFVYVASHDLKAPLRGVETLAALITKAVGESLPENKKDLINLMRSRIKRMERLLDDLLIYSRVGRIPTAREHVDCNALVNDIAALLSPPKDFVILPENLPSFSTYRTPLEQVLRNLIGNAVKHHNRPNGRVIVKAKEVDGFYEFSVSDDGMGIPPEFHEKIFQMFQTLRPRDEVEGSGMGLALVKKIIDELRGTVWVHSSPGHGSIFYFTWPMKIAEKTDGV